MSISAVSHQLLSARVNTVRPVIQRFLEMRAEFAVIFGCLLASCSAIYFHIGETEKKCFVEEIPEDTMVTGHYKVQYKDSSTQNFQESAPFIGMHVEVLDPERNVILSKYYSDQGKFTFTSHSPGEHVICIHSNSTSRWGFQPSGILRIHLSMLTGEHAIDYKEVASKEKLTDIQVRIRQLLDQSDQILKEQGYQQTREENFRRMSESTNQRVLWWAVVQTFALLATGFWQIRHLKSFFEAKKLV